MRLKQVETGQPLHWRVVLTLARLMSGHTPDVLRAVMYRPAFFGRPYSALAHRALRGPSPWSVGERELFAAFVSRQNACAFCLAAHGAVAAQTFGSTRLDAAQLDAILTNWRSAPMSEPVRATLAFLQKLTLTPDAVSADDILPLRAAGVSDQAIEDAIAICALFCTINRVADALGFTPPTPAQAQRGAKTLLARGYRF